MIHRLKKHAGVFALIGMVLFFPSFFSITYRINSGSYLAKLSNILATGTIADLKNFYLHNPTSPFMHLLDYLCIIGYALMTIGLIYFSERSVSNRVITSINRGCIGLAVGVGIIDIVETTITFIGSMNEYHIHDLFMNIHIYGTYLKGLIWLVFAWVFILVVIMLWTMKKERRE